MSPKLTIAFQETSVTATDFIHELNDPKLLKNGTLPPQALAALKRKQILRLRENIVLLTAKREEFNRKMDDYMENLKSLIRSLEKSLHGELRKGSESPAASTSAATVVRCMGCDGQRVFKDLQIVYARESEDSMAIPTEVYVLDAGSLKKGHFLCESCGEGQMVIRSV